MFPVQPSNTIVKGSIPSGIRRDSSGRRAVMRNTEVMSTAKVHEYPSAKEFKVTDSLLELEKTGLKVAETVEVGDIVRRCITYLIICLELVKSFASELL